jgi:hypothetical protein
MTTMTWKPIAWATLLALLASVQLASAFYDPTVQRWITRDPIGEVGFECSRRTLSDLLRPGPNPHAFLGNSPLDKRDPFGLAEDFMDPSKGDKAIFDLLKKLKKIYDSMPDNPKECMDPCTSATSLRAICDCLWEAMQKMKKNPKGGANDMAECVCLVSSDENCDRKWLKVINEIFKIK